MVYYIVLPLRKCPIIWRHKIAITYISTSCVQCTYLTYMLHSSILIDCFLVFYPFHLPTQGNLFLKIDATNIFIFNNYIFNDECVGSFKNVQNNCEIQLTLLNRRSLAYCYWSKMQNWWETLLVLHMSYKYSTYNKW